MSETWLVWGGGGHGRVIADLIVAVGGRVLGFVDQRPGGADCIPETEFIDAVRNGSALPLGATHVALGLGDNAARLAAWNELRHIMAPALRHPDVTISPRATIGAGTVVLPRAVVHTDARVGEAVILNTGCIVEHDCEVADGVHISPGAVLTGAVVVGEGAWIGAGAVLLPGVRVGAGSIVGAGAVVTRNVQKDVTVVGNPAQQVLRARPGARRA